MLKAIGKSKKGRKSSNAEAHFRKYMGGEHFITPTIIAHGWVRPDKIAYELSTGEGLDNDKIFGVTTDRFSIALTMAWPSEEQAKMYIRFLQMKLDGRGAGR